MKELKGIPCELPYVGYLMYDTPPMADGRSRVHLYHPVTKHRCWLTLAKYRLEVSLGRLLKESEEADHQDGDTTNDDVDNIQPLGRYENIVKAVQQLGRTAVYRDLICPVCGVNFQRRAYRVDLKIQRGHTPTCSRKCGGVFSHQ